MKEWHHEDFSSFELVWDGMYIKIGKTEKNMLTELLK